MSVLVQSQRVSGTNVTLLSKHYILDPPIGQTGSLCSTISIPQA